MYIDNNIGNLIFSKNETSKIFSHPCIFLIFIGEEKLIRKIASA